LRDTRRSGRQYMYHGLTHAQKVNEPTEMRRCEDVKREERSHVLGKPTNQNQGLRDFGCRAKSGTQKSVAGVPSKGGGRRLENGEQHKTRSGGRMGEVKFPGYTWKQGFWTTGRGRTDETKELLCNESASCLSASTTRKNCIGYVQGSGYERGEKKRLEGPEKEWKIVKTGRVKNVGKSPRMETQEV